MYNTIPQNLPVSEAQAAREQARYQAVFSSGKRFINLTLLNVERRKLSGIEYVHSTPYVDDRAGGITRYHFEIRGGYTDFQFDPSKGQFRYAMLDSDHNRQFLASHHHLDFWYIEDDDVRKDIEERSKAIEEAIKNKNNGCAAQPEPKVEEKRGRGRPKKEDSVKDEVKAENQQAADVPINTILPPIPSDLVTVRTTRMVTP